MLLLSRATRPLLLLRPPSDAGPAELGGVQLHPRRLSNVSRIVLLRNGESAANIDVEEYCRTPDWRIGITERGERQARNAGARLVEMLGPGAPVYCYFSPYLRSKATMQHVMDEISERLDIVGIREDARLRDGDMGRFCSPEELRACLQERVRYGKFFYRFPHGESAADVADRVSSFLDAFQRERLEFPDDTTVVITTHGQWIRLFVKRWFNLTVETYDSMMSPPVGTCVQLERVHSNFYKLTPDSIAALNLSHIATCNDAGYRFRNTRILGSLEEGAPYM